MVRDFRTKSTPIVYCGQFDIVSAAAAHACSLFGRVRTQATSPTETALEMGVETGMIGNPSYDRMMAQPRSSKSKPTRRPAAGRAGPAAKPATGAEAGHKEWVKKLAQFIDSRDLRSHDVAELASRYLRAWDQQPVGAAMINHFRSSRSKRPRYPREDKTVSAIAWALQDLGVWDGKDRADRRKEMAAWTALIGRSLEAARPIFPLPPSTNGRVALQRFLIGLADQNVDANRPPVIQIFGATPFLTGLHRGIAQAVAECAEAGIYVLFVFEPSWEYSPRWRIDLAEVLLSRLSHESRGRKFLYCFTLPSISSGSGPHCLSGLWVRLGLYALPTATSPVELKLSLAYLTTLDVLRAWIYFEPPRAGSPDLSGEASLLEETHTAQVRTLWRDSLKQRSHTAVDDPQLLDDLLTKEST